MKLSFKSTIGFFIVKIYDKTHHTVMITSLFVVEFFEHTKVRGIFTPTNVVALLSNSTDQLS